MASTPRRREPRIPRRLPPRPTFAADAPAVAATSNEEARQRRETERAMQAAERESRYLMSELKRVGAVTATCVGMLVALAILQRVQAP